MSILSQFKQSQNTDFPNVRPSLDLRFALAKKLDPRITFTRGSTGTYFGSDGLMRTAGVNEPRFDHDPITGQSLGLLIEESRTNLVTYSEQFDNSSWTKSNGSISANSILAPDGTITADAFIENTTANAYHFCVKTITKAASSITYTFSSFAQSKGGRRIGLRLSSGSNGAVSTFNVVPGTITTAAGVYGTGFSNASSSITQYPNNWYRIVLTVTSDTTTSISSQFYLDNGTTPTYTGDGTSGIYIWGAQLEAGAFPTSYIPTTASTVTRSADTATMTGTNLSSWYNQTEGTFFTDVKSSTNFISSNNASPFGIFSTANTIVLANYHSISSIWFFRNSFSLNNAILSANMTVSSSRKSIATYRTGPPDYYTAAFAGSNIRNSTTNSLSANTKTATLRTDQSYLELSPIRGGLVSLNGTIARLTYYPIALTQNQLINLTS